MRVSADEEGLEALKTLHDVLSAIRQTLDEIGAPTKGDGGARLNLHERLIDWLAGRREPRHAGRSEVGIVRHRPIRGSDVEAWIKTRRDEYSARGPLAQVSIVDGTKINSCGYYALDDLLDDYRLHADTGTPLDEPVGDGD